MPTTYQNDLFLRTARGETVERPPVWLMRQAGRILPQYRALRASLSGFKELVSTPDLAAEVTIQPVDELGVDAAIIFSDILVIPEALGLDYNMIEKVGPRFPETIKSAADVEKLRPAADAPSHLGYVFDALDATKQRLDNRVPLIGFAGAPWTVATYMIGGRGTPDQAPAHALKAENRPVFDALMARITEATIEYLDAQIQAGAETVKLFDSWAGSLKGADFQTYAVDPAARIIGELKRRHPDVPVIAFPREAGDGYVGFHAATGADCVAVDDSVDAEWVAENVQPQGCVQGNLASRHMVTGGDELVREVRRIREALSGGAHIFNLGHGITPDADPANVELMIETLREGVPA
ncbi:MAG: uroporphyrinogen decarboxylase [Jannaschia sp.]